MLTIGWWCPNKCIQMLAWSSLHPWRAQFRPMSRWFWPVFLDILLTNRLYTVPDTDLPMITIITRLYSHVIIIPSSIQLQTSNPRLPRSDMAPKTPLRCLAFLQNCGVLWSFNGPSSSMWSIFTWLLYAWSIMKWDSGVKWKLMGSGNAPVGSKWSNGCLTCAQPEALS